MTGAIHRRRFVAIGAGLGLLVVAGTGVAAPAVAKTYYVPVTRTLVLHGHGYGHGHGMSQYGAQGAALQGKSYRQILGFYYPHTQVEHRSGTMRVLVSADSSPNVVVRPAKGMLVRDVADRQAWRLPTRSAIDSWRILPRPKQPARSLVQFHGSTGWHRWKVPGRGTVSGTAQFEASRPLTLVLGNGTARYRGALRSAAPYDGAATRDTVNVLGLDDYVRGVVAAEMPASWQPQALRAQAVAARTYAAYVKRTATGRPYQICDTTACQVYRGIAAETAATDTAVAATAGQILSYDGKPALTQFSASSGGWTAAGGLPYLPAKQDPYDGWSGNGVHRWTTRISAQSLEHRFPELGRLQTVRVVDRDGHGMWGGRVSQLLLQGSRSSVALTGDDLRAAYGLRSTWFTFAPTPIIAAWRAMGGAKSPLGSPKSAEEPVRSADGRHGARQVFTSGRAYWAPATGARGLTGPILRRYRHATGPESRYGFPVSGVLRTSDGGRKARFEHGMFFASRHTGPRPVYGRILVAYAHRHFSAGRLGYPVTSPQPVHHGLRSRFQHGSITWDKRADTVTVVVR